MSGLTLLESPGARSSDRPVQPGDVVRVPGPVRLPSGRRIRTDFYTALDVQRGRVLVEASLDCTSLPPRYHAPTAAEKAAGAPVPLAAQPTRVWLLPGDYTAYDAGQTDGQHPLYIHDR